MDSKYAQSSLRVSLANQKIQGKTLYYSLAKKQQKSFSFLKNQRLLVLDFDDGKLFYVNETKNLPFKTQIPNPKNNQFATIEETKYVHEPNSNEIQFTFPVNKQKTVWKFVFQTNDLADEWIKIIQFQKYSHSVKEKDLRSLNKAIFQLPKIERQKANDIVKQPQRNIVVDQSRMMNERAMTKPVKDTPKSDNKNRSNNWDDWNQRFYQERNILTLYEFQVAAVNSFYKTINKDSYLQDKIRNYQNQSFNIKIANRFTLNAKKIKCEFRNYQFIIEATNKNPIVGVPLACLIQFQNIVGLVKAKFPEKVQSYIFDNTIKDQLHQLQRYTRVKNRVLQQCSILNLAKFYDPKSRTPLFYLQNLHQYLPVNLQFPQEQTLIRPQYMLDHVDYFITTGPQQKIGKTQNRQLKQLAFMVTEKCKGFSNSFFTRQFPVVRITQLKNIFHQQGINLKFLPLVYNQCTNPYVKKHIYTAMAAKIVKDYIYESIIKIRLKQENALQKIVQQTFLILLQGNNNRSNQIWKQISLIFKRKFNIILNHKEIIPGVFLNSLLELVPCKIDLKRLNKHKKIFEQMKIIQSGFLKQLQPKIKSYYKFLPEHIEALKQEARLQTKSPQTSQKILHQLFNHKDKKYQTFYQFGRNQQWMIEYLSLYFPPQNIATQQDDRINFLYDSINSQPPSYFTMNLTKSYLQWCNKKQNIDEFKAVFEQAMEIANYWLEEIHPIRSDLFEILSDYHSILGSTEDMLKYMKQSLVISTKFWGKDSQHVGYKLYQLADRFLRAGKKKESLEYYFKAKENMQVNKAKTNKHALSLMKIASIYLSDLQYDKAIQYGQQSIKSFEDYQKRVNSQGIFYEPYKIKSFQILARVYQICDRRTQYKDLALSCARKFNQTKNEQVFEQMVRICLASSIFKSNNDRCQSFIKLVKSIISDSRDYHGDQKKAIHNLMSMSEDITVMQRFVFKFEQFQRSLFELHSKKRQLTDDSQQFINILKNVINLVGYEYTKGLVDEKISCSL